jgi:hypothetical protein
MEPSGRARDFRGDHMEHGLPLTNRQVAERLTKIADLLESQGANPFRVKAYRLAAETLLAMALPVHELLADEGLPGLMKLPVVTSQFGGLRGHRVVRGREGECKEHYAEHEPKSQQKLLADA